MEIYVKISFISIFSLFYGFQIQYRRDILSGSLPITFQIQI